MNAADRLAAYDAVGVHVYLDHGVLRVRGDAGLVAAAKPALRQHRHDLLDHLSHRLAGGQPIAPTVATAARCSSGPSGSVPPSRFP